jgi:hypothetical protein
MGVGSESVGDSAPCWARISKPERVNPTRKVATSEAVNTPVKAGKRNCRTLLKPLAASVSVEATV